MTQKFQYAKEAARRIEGMLSDFSMAAMDSLLSFQDESNVRGNIIEFGVFRGRSAAILGSHLVRDERLILVDVTDYFDRPAIVGICPQSEFVICSSEKFKAEFVDYKKLRHQCRFIHIDSSHLYRATFKELALAEDLLQDKGIIVLDDFTNLNYSQILSATYKYIFTTWTK